MLQGIIRRVNISGLFGRYDYVIPQSGDLHSPAILYGDNGVGKSTILNLIFHLLSSAGDRGHRTALRKIKFSEVRVELLNGTMLSATRTGEFDDDETIVLQVHHYQNLVAEWKYTGSRSRYHFEDDTVFRDFIESGIDPSEISQSALRRLYQKKSVDDGVKRGEKEYLSTLSQDAPNIFYLNADRKLDSDSVADPSDEIEIRQILGRRELKRTTDILHASRGISLKQALSTASRWVNRRAVRSANRGAENVHLVYERIIGQLATDYNDEELQVERSEIDNLISSIDDIERDALAFSKYELTSELEMARFRRALSSEIDQANAISARLITPYVESLSSRLEAIRPVYDVLNNFVTVINSFLTRKKINYTLSQGFFITDELNDALEPSELSSGEQQLLLIFSYVLAARDHPSVFIIDEPEISLNVKWQRKMVNSLLQVAAGSQIQFILASHSIELLTQHEDSVVTVG